MPQDITVFEKKTGLQSSRNIFYFRHFLKKCSFFLNNEKAKEQRFILLYIVNIQQKDVAWKMPLSLGGLIQSPPPLFPHAYLNERLGCGGFIGKTW